MSGRKGKKLSGKEGINFYTIIHLRKGLVDNFLAHIRNVKLDVFIHNEFQVIRGLARSLS